MPLKRADPIYDAALPATWQWLNAQAREGIVDLGVRALEATLAQSRVAIATLTAPALDAPVLMPAHVDLLCQTSPRPAAEPEIAAFLHGPNRGTPEVRVCWRADLPADTNADWEEHCRATLAVCPLSSPECLSVPLPEFKAWLRGETRQDSGDLLGETVDEEEARASDSPANRRGVVWTGRECLAVSARNAEEFAAVRPQAVIVLPATAGGWSTLGHVPEAPAEPEVYGKLTTEERQPLAPIDLGAVAYERSRNRRILRVHPSLPRPVWKGADNDALTQFAADETKTWSGTWLGDESKTFGPPLRYPSGFVLIGPRQNVRAELPRASFDDDLEEHNLDAESKISLAVHTADVVQETRRNAERLNLPPTLQQSLVAAAERHDLGKADPRFQALLLNSSLAFAELQPTLWAKSARGAGAAKPVQVPAGFRHEMLSLQFAAALADDLAAADRDLMLHAIAAHHGRARPWAPVVDDPSPPEVSLNGFAGAEGKTLDVTLTSAERLAMPPHRLDSGVARRFWNLNRRFGWWGLAWLETTLRLADWTSSAAPIESAPAVTLKPLTRPPLTVATPPRKLLCIGPSGANPLGFLCGLGLIRHVATKLDPAVRLHWRISNGAWTPVLTGTHEVLDDEDGFSEWLLATLREEPQRHPLKWLNELPKERLGLKRPSEYSSAAESATWDDRLAADWLSCNGSDVSEPDNSNQLQTARRDYFPKSVEAIIEDLSREQLVRTLFRQWDYGDPIHKVSLHLEPREDRRHAYQWNRPVGDPTRSLCGGMVGANRLAMEAWPFFQSVAVGSELQTVGFQGTRPMRGIWWTWPLWTTPLNSHEISAVLNLKELRPNLKSRSGTDVKNVLRLRGVDAVFRLRRILVEKTPNFTAPVAV